GLWASACRFLVGDKPQRADVTVVLAGETDRRPARALELLDQGYGTRLVLERPRFIAGRCRNWQRNMRRACPRRMRLLCVRFTACQRARRRRKPAVAWRRLAEEMCCW